MTEMMRAELSCPSCGNDDPERLLTVTVPYRNGDLLGHILRGWRCGVCGRMASEPIAEPADASKSGAD